MPQSAELNELPAALHATLSQAIDQASITEVRLLDDLMPLVLMMRGHAMEAFAVGKESDYLPLYSAFKKHFMAQGAAWATKDVSFVFCLPAAHPATEEFRSKVEVDVYFCRKYVVQLQNDIASSLARLPFLPLSPIHGGSIRPPSAQALLRSRNVKTELANRLIVPGTGAQTILHACVDGRYGSPSDFEGGRADALQAASEEVRSQSILRSISIQNFRAYRTTKEFPLGSAVTVLYGPNGFGKTSFFDAVDFVVTGGVGRLTKNSAGFVKAAKHLDSKDAPTTVSLTFERDGATHTIVRDLADPNKATLDGAVTDRKEILAKLTGGEPSATDRVDNLVALFRATHLFSQDRQELTGQVAENCELPADIVSRMLAFDDYVSGLRKTKEVLELAKQQIANAQQTANTAQKLSEADEIELQRLQGLQSSAVASETLEEQVRGLEQSIEHLGLDVSSLGPRRDIRSLRVLLEAASTEATLQKSTLEKCLESLAALSGLKAELKQHEAPLSEYEAAVTAAEVFHRDSELKLHASQAELAKQRASEADAKSTRDALSWVIAARPEFTRLCSEAADLKTRLEESSALRAQHRDSQVAARTSLSQAAEAYGKAAASHRAAREQAVRIRSAQDRLGQVQTSEALIAEAQAEEMQISRSLEELKSTLNDERQAVLSQQLLIERVQRDLNTARREASEVHELIATLRTHVKDETCLLCGHDHGTNDELLKAIDRRLEQDDALLRASEQLTEETDKKLMLDAGCQSLIDQIRQQEQRLKQRVEQREALERGRADFWSMLAAIGIDIAENLPKQISDKAAQAKAAEDQTAKDLETAKKTQQDAEDAVKASESAESVLVGIVDVLSRSLAASQKSLNELVNNKRRGAFDVGAELSILEGSLNEANERVSACAMAIQEASALVESHRAEHAASQTRVQSARSAIESAVRHKGMLDGRIQSLIASLSAAGLSTDVEADQILADIAVTVRRHEAANALSNRAIELEIALDAAATSAAFDSIRKRIAEKQQVAQEAQARIDLLSPWVKYFDDAYKLLGSQQATATEHFTNEYGPRTAVIQRRLRPVYGFGDIEVSSKGSAISIHVNRNEEALRPTDYFSQSQVQTLVLGLFLTACSSQTWSGFSTIMMDDPVTHFDDLNTYALLDLVSGLQSSQEGNKQFVISTCDEKLLHLARQKFRHLGNAAKFYRFSAIGADGPMVTEIPA